MDNELVEYRGFFIFWRKPLNSGKWTAGITSGSPSLFPAIEPSGAGVIGGHSRDDMLVNAKLYIDGMLDRSSAAYPYGGTEPHAQDRQGRRWQRFLLGHLSATNARMLMP